MYGDIPDYSYGIMDYVDDGFLVGGSLGSTFHFIRGFKNSPNDGRLAGGIGAVRTNLPRVAGSGGARLAVFSVFESAMSRARGQSIVYILYMYSRQACTASVFGSLAKRCAQQ